MKENHLRLTGGVLFGLTILLALFWCLNQSGLTGWFIRLTERFSGERLVFISRVITILAVCFPGYLVRNYFNGLAWNEHVRNQKPPDRAESARRSRYVEAQQAPKKAAVQLANLPSTQEEYIINCAGCGHYFSSSKADPALKCPSCGEPIQNTTPS
jgi:hypothetical protein